MNTTGFEIQLVLSRDLKSQETALLVILSENGVEKMSSNSAQAKILQ